MHMLTKPSRRDQRRFGDVAKSYYMGCHPQFYPGLYLDPHTVFLSRQCRRDRADSHGSSLHPDLLQHYTKLQRNKRYVHRPHRHSHRQHHQRSGHWLPTIVVFRP